MVAVADFSQMLMWLGIFQIDHRKTNLPAVGIAVSCGPPHCVDSRSELGLTFLCTVIFIRPFMDLSVGGLFRETKTNEHCPALLMPGGDSKLRICMSSKGQPYHCWGILHRDCQGFILASTSVLMRVLALTDSAWMM